jgi:hypothetical protein
MSKDNHGQTPAAWTGTFGIVWIVWEKASSRRKN